MGTQQFCLKWNNHQSNMLSVFEQLLSTEALVDVTLACDGLSLKAHKMVLSACSPYFQSLFLENPCKHPIVIMKDMRYTELKAIIDFMYRGEVNVSHDQLNALLRTAETLKVKGLAEVSGENRSAAGMVQQEIVQQNITTTPATGPPPQTRSDSPTLLSKRKRGRPRKRSLSDSNRSDDEPIPSKIKEPESPEIEELSGDASIEANDISLSSNSQTQVHQSLPSSSVHNSHLNKHPSSIQSSHDSQVEEPPSDDGDFEVEPSKLMEQTLTTDVPVMSNSTPQSTVAPSVHIVPLSSSSGLDVNTRSIVPSGSDSTTLVPASASIASDSLSSSQMQGPDSPQDIKPALLSFEEPPISPVAGPSQDRSMMMYMDTSGVPAIPGTSYQDNQTAIVQHESQPQGILASEENGDFYNVVLRPYSYSEKESCYSFEVISTTRTDLQVDRDIQGCAQSESVQPVPDSFKCFPDGDVTQRTTPPDIEFSEIVVVSDTNSESSDCKDQNLSPGNSDNHGDLSPGNSDNDCEDQNSDNHGDHASNVKDAEYSISKNVSVQRENPNVAQFRNPTISFKKFSHGYRFYCPFCSHHSKYRQAVLVHVRQHTGEKPYVCDYCEKAFAVKQNFVIHVKRHEALLKSFNCNVCQKYFSSKQLLRRHSWICRKVNSHKCDICERTFSKKNHLMLHLKVHSGVEKQFKCSRCAKEYFYKKSLLRHQETHAEQI